MISALLFAAQAAAHVPSPVASAPPEVRFDLSATKRVDVAGDDPIVVTARRGEHPARLGQVLPSTTGPLLPTATLDLGDGITAASGVRSHPREGVAEFHFKLTVPF